MDSITHVFLGGSIAAAFAPAGRRRQALVMGAIFGSLPDLDVPFLYALPFGEVTRITWHRGPAHALAMVVPYGLLLCALLQRWWSPMREAPRAWWAGLMLALLSHPLIDALTVYGTQLWWPSPVSPTMWSSLFILDPLLLLVLAVGAVAAWFARDPERARRWARVGLTVALAYVGWSAVAKQLVERAVDASLAGTPLAQAPRFSVPTPLNTLLWRVVVMTPDGYLEGERSLVADRGPIRFRAHHVDPEALRQVASQPDVARLRWFASGFVEAEVQGDTIVLTDLRMGSDPDYFFRYVVARRVGGAWRAVPAQREPARVTGGSTLAGLWRRIGSEPATGP